MLVVLYCPLTVESQDSGCSSLYLLFAACATQYEVEFTDGDLWFPYLLFPIHITLGHMVNVPVSCLLSFFSLLHPLRSPFPFFTYFLFSHGTREGAPVYICHRVTSPSCALVYLKNGDFSYVAMEQVLELSGMEKDLEKYLPHGAWCLVSHG